MTATISRHLRDIAGQMPEVTNYRPEWQLKAGKELRSSSIGHLITNDEDVYRVKVAVPYTVNHYSRLKDAYNRGKWNGVLEYQKQVLKAVGLSETEIADIIQTKKEELFN